MDNDWLHVELSDLDELRYKRSRGHRWGYEIELENNELYCGKLLVLENGEYSSLHYHKVKDETFIVLIGTVGLFYMDDDKEDGIGDVLEMGDKYRVKPLVHHRFHAIEIPSIILEISTHHDDNDTYRVEV